MEGGAWIGCGPRVSGAYLILSPRNSENLAGLAKRSGDVGGVFGNCTTAVLCNQKGWWFSTVVE